ncbi:MAG: enoyl-CoA hydratase/isomerase family protein, partial [Candidatus Eremiobacteraeota bacterium]|nr:enoyl-CoA hydratase/isomerase family protein [Candidatus Eremiobacteraeota bacterium]
TEFATILRERKANVRDAVDAAEHSAKPIAAAIDGRALGGGLELALACDLRFATPSSQFGFPEIKLGLIPGAGGTQRLPRVLKGGSMEGVIAALELILKGDPIDAERAEALELIDGVGADAVPRAAEAIRRFTGARRRVSERSASAYPQVFSEGHKRVPPEDRGGFAAHKALDAVEAATQWPFNHGIARELRYFLELLTGSESRAYQHIFFAERELGKIPGIPTDGAVRPIRRAAVIGAGTMGSGIAITFANAGVPVSVLDASKEAIERGRATIEQSYADQVKRRRLSEEEAKRRHGHVHFIERFEDVADADIVIEAVFEDLAIKKEVFAKLDAVAKPDAVLATNTSTLDVDAIASATSRPQQVIGMHFFSPAYIMKLLEIVRGKASSPQTIGAAIALAKKLRKVGVLVANCDGFVGNRMLAPYFREAAHLLEEGALPQQIDAAMTDFGFAMGPFAVSDLAGVDVGARIRAEREKAGRLGAGRVPRFDVLLFERGRFGQKTGAGFYRYDTGERIPKPDPEVEALIVAESRELGIERRSIGNDEIVKRCVYALINEGANVLYDGIALRSSDIDIVWIYGYGFPPFRGGPMYYADTLGLKRVLAEVERFHGEFGVRWKPSPLLVELATTGKTFSSYRPALTEVAP